MPMIEHRCHAGGKPDKLVTDHALYRALGKTNAERQSVYRGLFKAHLSPGNLNEIRDAINKAWVLGSDRFKERVAAAATRRVAPLPKGRPRSREI